jgi:hypothetical protein
MGIEQFFGEEANRPFIKTDYEPEKHDLPPYKGASPEQQDLYDSRIEALNKIYTNPALSAHERDRAFRECENLLKEIVGTREVTGSGQVENEKWGNTAKTGLEF